MIAVEPLGELLLLRARRARARALICAPFVKVAVLGRVLAAIAADVEVELFTRWRPEEVAAGVSDTEVLSAVRKRGGSVYLCDALHAKLFLFDDSGLMGSANLTAKALGWSTEPNLELLVDIDAGLPAVAELVVELRERSIEASDELAAEIERVAALLPHPTQAVAKPILGEDLAVDSETWWPHLREPRDLFVSYAEGAERLSRTSAAAAESDLLHLDVPAGLERETFEQLVGTRMQQAPTIVRLDEILVESRRFGEVRDLFAAELGLDRFAADHAWQTTMRWLLYFLPGRYRRLVPSHSELMVRRQETR